MVAMTGTCNRTATRFMDDLLMLGMLNSPSTERRRDWPLNHRECQCSDYDWRTDHSGSALGGALQDGLQLRHGKGPNRVRNDLASASTMMFGTVLLRNTRALVNRPSLARLARIRRTRPMNRLAIESSAASNAFQSPRGGRWIKSTRGGLPMGAMIPECAVACVIGPCCADTATHCDRLTASAVPTHRSGGAAADARGPPESRSPRTAQRKIALQCRLQTARFASSALVQGARCGLNRAGTDVAFVE